MVVIPPANYIFMKLIKIKFFILSASQDTCGQEKIKTFALEHKSKGQGHKSTPPLPLIMYQSIPSVTTPREISGHWTENFARGNGFD